MIVVIEQYNAHEYSDLMDEMFRLRARVFRDRLRWDVQVVDGKERDKYDDEWPVYLVYADDELRKVKGSLRLLQPLVRPFSPIFSVIRFPMPYISAPQRPGNVPGSAWKTMVCASGIGRNCWSRRLL